MNNAASFLFISTFAFLLWLTGGVFEVGRTSCSFQVDQHGAATCEIPLFTSPAAGLSPTLSLKFNSKWSGDSLGAQFVLGGLSTIHRGPKQYQLDGVVHGIDFTQDDRLTLDTLRLVLVNGTYWAEGAEFRSEIDSFSQITRTGEGFTMRTAAKQMMEYGLTQDSRVLAQGKASVNFWALNRVQDWAGNYFTLSYAQTPELGDYRLSYINYTGNVRMGLLPYNSIEFIYETRPDIKPIFVAGSIMQTSLRLQQVKAITEGILVKQYRLTYQQDCLTNYSQLASVQECDGNNTCFPPTRFTWSSVCPAEAVYISKPGIYSKVDSGSDSDPMVSLNIARFRISDLNNDGVTDIYQVTGYGQTTNDTIWIRNGSLWNSLQGPPTFIRGSVDAATVDMQRIRLHDMNGDGHTDVHYIPSNGSPAPDLFYILHEDGSYQTYTGLSHTIPSSLSLGALALKRIMYGDFNGDGRLDLFQVTDYGNSPPSNSLIYLNLADGQWSPAISAPAFSIRGYVDAAQVDLDRVRIVDWNGDGLSDLYWQTEGDTPTTDLVYINTGNATSGYFSTPPVSGPMTQLRKPLEDARADIARLQMGDFNCDGQIDGYVVTLGDNPDQVWINRGNGTYQVVAGPRTNINEHPVATVIDARRIAMVEWNGDGCTDVHYVQSRNGVPAKDLIYISSGVPELLFPLSVDGVESIISAPLPQANLDLACFSFGDFNGDGSTDQYRLNRYNTTQPDTLFITPYGKPMVTEIIDGFGALVKVEYQPLSNQEVYTDSLPDPVYPERKLQGAILVVARTEQSDGLGGFRNFSFRYHDSRYTQGFGPLGFAMLQHRDDLHNITVYTNYSQDWRKRLHQRVTTQRTFSSSGGLLEYNDQQYEVRNYTNLPQEPLRFVVLSRQNIRNSYTLVGSQWFSTNLVELLHDQWGNPIWTNSTAFDSLGNLYNSITTDTYTPANVSLWDLGRLIQRNVTQMRRGDVLAPAITRLINYSYDTTTALLIRQVQDPGTDVQVITDHARDLFGNALNVNVTQMRRGDVLAPAITRLTNYSYDITTALLIRQVQDPGTDVQVITDYARDLFGNALNVNVTGWAMPTRSTWIQFDQRGRYAVESRNALGHIVLMQHEPLFGHVVNATDENGLSTLSSYDTFGRLQTVVYPDQTQEVHYWGWCSSTENDLFCPFPPIGVYWQMSISREAVNSTTYYDMLDRKVRTRSWGIRGQIILQDVIYNNLGLVNSRSEPYFNGSSTLYWTRYCYDELDREITLIQPDGNTSHIIYNGLVTTMINALLQNQTRIVDAANHIVVSIDNAGQETIYSYDSAGNNNWITDSEGNSILRTFNLQGKMTSEWDGDRGNWTYQYDALGELLGRKHATSGRWVQWSYDLLGRNLDEIGSDGSSTQRAYDKATGKGIGKLWWKKNNEANITSEETMAYDNLGRLFQSTTVVGKDVFVSTRLYDRLSRLQWEQFVGVGTWLGINYTYDEFNHLICTQAGNLSLTVLDMDAHGRVVKSLYGNGVTLWDQYDPAMGYLSNILAISPNTSKIQDLAYRYNAIGTLLSRTDSIRGLSEQLQYDALNRLSQSSVNGGKLVKTYTYDALGNIIFKSDFGSYEYDPSRPHAVTQVHKVITGQIINYLYDDEGNMVNGEGRTLSYNAHGLSSSILSADTGKNVLFAYNADGHLLQRTDRTLSNGGIISETITTTIGWYQKIVSNGTAITHRYTLGFGTLTGANVSYILHDHLGSPDIIVNDKGIEIEWHSYDAFGRGRNPATWGDETPSPCSSNVTDRGFTNHVELCNVELVHMGGRVYDPLLGRFVSPDPLIQFPENMQSFNRYSYVLNNPLTYTDPTGFGIFGSIGRFFGRIFHGIGHFFGHLAHSVVNAIRHSELVRSLIRIALNAGANLIPFCQGWCSYVVDVAYSVLVTKIEGGSWSDALKGATLTLAQDGAFNLVGDFTSGPTLADNAANTLGHGLVGGTFSVASGGKFGAGFASAAIGDAAGIMSSELGKPGQLLVTSMAGGIASSVSGGSFGEGMTTSVAGLIFNSWQHDTKNFIGGAAHGLSFGFYNPSWADSNSRSYTAGDIASLFAPGGVLKLVGRGGRLLILTSRGLNANPFRGLTAEQIVARLERGGARTGPFKPRGRDPGAGLGDFYNPKTGRSFHLDVNHPPPKGPHISGHTWGKNNERNRTGYKKEFFFQ